MITRHSWLPLWVLASLGTNIRADVIVETAAGFKPVRIYDDDSARWVNIIMPCLINSDYCEDFLTKGPLRILMVKLYVLNIAGLETLFQSPGWWVTSSRLSPSLAVSPSSPHQWTQVICLLVFTGLPLSGTTSDGRLLAFFWDFKIAPIIWWSKDI